MKKLLSLALVVLLPAILMAADTNISDTDVKVEDDASYTFMEDAELKINGNAIVFFENVISTKAVSPTKPYQVAMSTTYNIVISSAAGGAWYEVGGK